MTVPRRRLPGPSGNALILAGGGVGEIAWELGNLRGTADAARPTGFHQKSAGPEDEPWVVPLPELTVMPVVRVIHQRTPSRREWSATALNQPVDRAAATSMPRD